uniref:HSF-type DNA-binding domain-containing protein n=1 Tax=Mycena chlorophos TaxID=658473 RepID=A0ABQ0M1I7_MYCCL|nr:predicted protein [Mycena chlorophos]
MHRERRACVKESGAPKPNVFSTPQRPPPSSSPSGPSKLTIRIPARPHPAPTKVRNRLNHPRTFMPALYDMLIACDDRIGWSRDGRAIEIPDIDLFTFVLVAYFPKLSLTSWRRCMLSYGFRSNTSRTTGTLSLSHPTLTRASKRSDFVEAIQAPRKNPPAKQRPWSRSSSVLSSPLSSVSGSEAGDDEVETMVDDTLPQAGPSTSISIIRDRDSFLVKLFRLCEDHTNAAVLRWDNHGRVVIRDPERLPGLLQLHSWAPRPRTFGGICREFFRHGFVLIPLRDKYRIPSTVFYAWSHPILDADYPMDELARLSAADAWQLAADEMDGDADGDADGEGEDEEGPMPLPAFNLKMEGVEMLASPDVDMDMDMDTEPPPQSDEPELETASNDSISDSSTCPAPAAPRGPLHARCKCKTSTGSGTPSLGAGWINFGGRVRCLGWRHEGRGAGLACEGQAWLQRGTWLRTGSAVRRLRCATSTSASASIASSCLARVTSRRRLIRECSPRELESVRKLGSDFQSALSMPPERASRQQRPQAPGRLPVILSARPQNIGADGPAPLVTSQIDATLLSSGSQSPFQPVPQSPVTKLRIRIPARPMMVANRTRKVGGRSGKTFMRLLYGALERSTHEGAGSIRWSIDGTIIEVPSVQRAVGEYFPHILAKSFRARMGGYGFRGAFRSTGTRGWKHPTLTRSSPRESFVDASIIRIRRYGQKRRSASSSPGDTLLPLVLPNQFNTNEPSTDHSTLQNELQVWTSATPGPAPEVRFLHPQNLTSTGTDLHDSDLDRALEPQPESSESFLLKIYSLSKDPANASIISWRGPEGGRRLDVHDPTKLVTLLRLLPATTTRTFGRFCAELKHHGFVLTPMWYPYHNKPNTFYAWKHPVLDETYPENELAHLTVDAALRMAEDAQRAALLNMAVPKEDVAVLGVEVFGVAEDSDVDASEEGNEKIAAQAVTSGP